MRVCHFITSKGIGRGEFYIDLVNELCHITDIYLLIPKNAKYLNRISQKVHIIEYTSKDSRFNPFFLYEIYHLIKTISPDIVHTHFAKSTEVFYGINKILRLKHIATKHNARKGKIFDKVQHVTAVSQGVAQSIKNPHVEIIYNGIIPQKPLPVEHPHKPFIMSAVGRLDKIKGYDILIKECSKLSFDFKLQIIGDGPQKQELHDLIKTLGLSQKVFLLGFRQDIPHLMNTSDLIVISSHSEGFSVSMIEAIFYAPILISRKVSGSIEILPSDFLIENFDIASKINTIYQQYSFFEEKFQKVKIVQTKNLVLADIAQKYLNFYSKVYK